MAKLYDRNGNEIVVSAGTSGSSSANEVEEVSVGSLPQIIKEKGCYLTTIGSVTSKYHNFLTSLPSHNGWSSYNGYTGSMNGDEATLAVNPNVSKTAGYFEIISLLEVGKEYTLMYTGSANINSIGVYLSTKSGSTGNLEIQINNAGSDVLNFGYFKVSEDTKMVGLAINTATQKETTFSLYVLAGRHTKIPVESTFTGASGYGLDMFIGTKLTGSGTVYKKTVSGSGRNAVMANKTFALFGDSVWDFASNGSLSIASIIEETLNCKIIDCAVGGTRLTGSRDSTNEYYPYDMTQIAEAFALHDFSTQISGGKNTMFQRLQDGNLDCLDGIILALGTNDFTAKASFNGEDKTSVEGGLKHIFESILTVYPTMKIYVTSTMRFVNAGTTVSTHTDGTVEDMNDLIKSICDEYSVPFIDVLHNVGSNTITRSSIQGDGVHLFGAKEAGLRYADVWIAQFLSKTTGIY